ncbi:hypothetical protein K445DRAFT_311977 [Daldinia sp. EC12]|nr:hypothetical protein K445DRAFT_311977 [Daldinia sp. EC12]
MGFFFSKVDLHGWYRTFGKCVGLLGLVLGVSVLGAPIVLIYMSRKRARLQALETQQDLLPKQPFPRDQDSTTTLETDSEDEPLIQTVARMSRSPSYCIPPFTLICVFSIVQVEQSIMYNGLQSVSSTETFSSLGQLVPFIVGLGAFAEAIWDSWRYLKAKLGKEGTEQGREKREEYRPMSPESLHNALELHPPNERPYQPKLASYSMRY